MKGIDPPSEMEKAYLSFLHTIKEYGMDKQLKKGALIGFSGGPDSVLLLHLLLRYRKEQGAFPIVAVHVHHGIRGEEADRDAAFSQSVCDALGVPFEVRHVDVPSYAKNNGMGIEEAARDLRYRCFDDIIRSRNDIKTIVLGHNATDNLETVILHLLRGCGGGGLAGIPVTRDNVVRPLLSVSKETVLSALSECEISYVIDSTNTNTDYARNYIRYEVLPALKRFSPSAEVSVGRVCRNLINDNDFLQKQAEKELDRLCREGLKANALCELHPAIFARVVRIVAERHASVLYQVHIEKLYELLNSGKSFRYDLPGGVRFVCDAGSCYFESLASQEVVETDFHECLKINQPLSLRSGAIVAYEGVEPNISPNIYNFSIKASLSSAIIEGELFVRYRKSGDSYCYGGMTRRLKKLFNDKKLSQRERESLPVLCDEKGIVWVPGFGVRDDGANDPGAISVAYFYN